MEKNTQHNTTQQDLALEIAAALKEFFVAEIKQTENTISIKLQDGKAFIVTVTEAE